MSCPARSTATQIPAPTLAANRIINPIQAAMTVWLIEVVFINSFLSDRSRTLEAVGPSERTIISYRY